MNEVYVHTCVHTYLHSKEEKEEEVEEEKRNLFILRSLMSVCVCFYKLRCMSIENKLAMRAYQLSHTAATGTGV